MKVIIRQVPSVENPLSQWRRISISLGKKSGLLIGLLLIDHHIIHDWDAHAEPLEETVNAATVNHSPVSKLIRGQPDDSPLAPPESNPMSAPQGLGETFPDISLSQDWRSSRRRWDLARSADRKQFVVSASSLPTTPHPSSPQTLSPGDLERPLGDRSLPSMQATWTPRKSDRTARLLIHHVRNLAAETRTTRTFYHSPNPLHQAFGRSQAAPLSWNHRKSLASPQGKPANGFVFISSLFGKRKNPFGRGVEFHNGVDLVGAQGTPILATAEGRVSRRKRSLGYGIHVIIDHGYGYETLYAHLSKKQVKPNQMVRRGDIVGFLGSTGRSTGPHLHYSVYLNHQAVDPKP